MMDIEEPIYNEKKRLQENTCMFEMLLQLFQVKQKSSVFNSNHMAPIHEQQQEINNIMQQFGLYQDNSNKKAQVQSMIQQQSNLYKQYQQKEQQKQQSSNGLFELIYLRHQQRELELKQLQQEQSELYLNYGLPTIDAMIDEKRQSSQLRSEEIDNINLFDNNNQLPSYYSQQQISQHNNSCNFSNDSNYYEEESSNDFSKISNQNFSTMIDTTKSINQNSYNENIYNQNTSTHHTNFSYQMDSEQPVKIESTCSNQDLPHNNSIINNCKQFNMQQRHGDCSSILESNLLIFKQLEQDSNKQNANNNLQMEQDNQKNANTSKNNTNNAQSDQFNKPIFKIQPQQISLNQKIQICGGLIFCDGILRNQKGLVHISFGFQQEQIVMVEEKKKLQIVSVQMQPDPNAIEPSLNEAISYLEACLKSNISLDSITNKIPEHQYKKIKNQLSPETFMTVKDRITNHMKNRNQFKNIMKNFMFDENILKWKDENFSIFLDQCYKYLQEYDKSQTSMYQYSIGRFNYLAQDVQMYEVGYSKSYLDLLGIDVESFSSMMMRGQKIDLIKDKQVLHQQTLYTMLQCLYNIEVVEIYTDIHTFDGFPLNLYQKQRKVEIPFHYKMNQTEYVFFITEMDVSMTDLQQLIQYRQNISNQQLSYDDFIRKELSYIFEDVEYSVHSQSFLEKYYKENLQELQSLKNIQSQKSQKPIQKNVKQEALLKPVQYNVVPKN